MVLFSIFIAAKQAPVKQNSKAPAKAAAAESDDEEEDSDDDDDDEDEEEPSKIAAVKGTFRYSNINHDKPSVFHDNFDWTQSFKYAK